MLLVLIKEALHAAFRYFLAHSGSESLEGLLLLRVEGGGHLDPNGDVLVAAASALEQGDALAPQTEGGAGLGTGGQVIGDLAIDGGDLQLSAHGGLIEGDRLLVKDGGALTDKLAAGLHPDVDDQIAGGAAVLAGVALAPEGDSLTVIDTGGDGHRDTALDLVVSGAVAVITGAVDDLAGAVALGALCGGGVGEAAAAPLDADHTGAPAVGAGVSGGTRLTAGAVTGLTGLSAGQLNGLLTAEGRLLKGDGQVDPQGLTLLGGVGLLLTAETAAKAAEAAAKEGAEDVAQVTHVKAAAAKATAAAKVGIDASVTELVITRALLLVRQHLVGLVDLFELGLGLFVAGVHIRVVFFGLLTVGLFDLFVRGALFHAQDFVIIPFILCHTLSPAYRGTPRAALNVSFQTEHRRGNAPPMRYLI